MALRDIYNVIIGTFCCLGIRNGDLIAIVNFVQWYRKAENRPDIKLYINPNVLVNKDYVHEFYKFLSTATDVFSLEEGYQNLPYHNVMLWDFRAITGDVVSIHNPHEQRKKVVVFPIYDAEYHTTRNWTDKLLNDTLWKYSLPGYEKILCVKDLPVNPVELHGFTISTDFMTNIQHIMEAEIFIGGDTGVSHFASALTPGPSKLEYYYPDRGMIHTIPFHYFNGKGKLNKYWLNLEGTTYNGKKI